MIPAPIDDAETDAAYAAKCMAVEVARAEGKAGKTVAHERVKEWLEACARGENLPPPQA